MSKWPTGKEEQALIELREEKGASLAEIAQLAGVSISTASVHLNGIIPLARMVARLPRYPEKFLQIRGDTALTSDWHSPYFSMKWLKRLLVVCRKLEISQLAIVGDLTDLKWASSWLTKDPTGSLEEELKISVSLLQLLLMTFDRVYWCYGNHEDRLIKALKGHDILPVMAELVSQTREGELFTSKAPTILLDDTWRLEHPKTYCRNATMLAAQLTTIFHKDVGIAHGHMIGYKHDISGKYLGIDLGGMFDMEKQEYLYLSGVTTHPRWNPGFWIYKDQKPRPFDDALINWDEWEIDGDEKIQLSNKSL